MEKNFGGPWTETKLQLVEKYLKAYLTALKKTSFKLGYIDAFAGAGSIQLTTFEDKDENEAAGLIRGSARRALELDPGFDAYILIENDTAAIEHLESLKEEFINKNIEIIHGDANVEIQKICTQSARGWRTRRAVVFLDPAGMQVDWATKEAIAKTRAIDVMQFSGTR